LDGIIVIIQNQVWMYNDYVDCCIVVFYKLAPLLINCLTGLAIVTIISPFS